MQRHLFWLSLPSVPIQALAQERPASSWLQQMVPSLLYPLAMPSYLMYFCISTEAFQG